MTSSGPLSQDLARAAQQSPERAAELARAAVVRAMGPADRERQAALHAQCFKKPLASGALTWRYDQCPVGSSLSFVTELPDGLAVSGYACNPRRAIARGEEDSLSVVGQTGDVMTSPLWRKFGLFSALDRTAMAASRDAGWPLVFGLPNRRSAHIFTGDLGWKQIGTVREWTFVLRADGRTRQARLADGRRRAWLSFLDQRRGAAALARMRKRAGELSIRPLERFPAEVLQLSKSIEARFEFMVRRDADYLNWRFFQAPARMHQVLGAYDAAQRLLGYVVLQKPDARGVGYLIDLLALTDPVRDGLIAAGLVKLQSQGASIARATAIDGSWWNLVLQQSGFVPPKPDNHLVVILHTHQVDHRLAKAAAQASRWYFTDGDRDDETMG